MTIACHDLSKVYADGTRALEAIDLELATGVFGLLGPNGAGKTTLMRLLVLAHEPTTGSRRYFELADHPRHRAEIRGWLGYLPQEFTPMGDLSGLETLILAGRLRGLRLTRRALERRALALLAAVDLEHAATRRSSDYSGGMQRRLGLALALVHSPRFLIVDEPTARLDPEERIRFRTLITALGDRMPVLLSTHIVEDIEATCPRIGILEQGALIFDDSPTELFRLADGKVWELAASSLEPSADVVAIGRRGGSARDVVFSLQPPTADATPARPTLEEAYAAFLAARREAPGHQGAPAQTATLRSDP